MSDKKDSIGLIDRTRDLRWWIIDQIFGHSKTGQIVPNPGDVIFDSHQGFLIVSDVDYLTGRSTLSLWKAPSNSSNGEDLNLLLGTGPGAVTESFRLFVDKSVTPYVASPCSRLMMRGSDAEYYMLFVGTTFSDKGRVISFIHDTTGKMLGEKIPFKRAVGIVDQREVVSWQTTPCLTTEDLKDGERVTMVSYSKEGHVVDTSVLVVQNSGATRQLDAGRRYVRGIGIQSPFIPESMPDTIEFPVNVPVEQLPMEGVVYYSDGSKETHPIDNQRMSLVGTDNYTATVSGESFDLVLIYPLADGEVAYEQKPTTERRIQKLYRARTTAVEGAYTVKLFVYPTWNTEHSQYYLEYWLYNLDRQTFYNVTSLIELGVNSNPFDPSRYSTLQTITVAIDLNKVNSQFKAVRHVQTFQVVLMSRGSENKANWAVKFRPDQPSSFGGGGVEAVLKQVNTNEWSVNVANGAVSKETWIQKLYTEVEPLYNADAGGLEARAPDPTHFRLKFTHNAYEYPVSQWDQTFSVNNDLSQGELLYIEWIYRTDTTDLQLAITGLPAHIYGN